MELHHLHVLERDACAQRHGHPVAGAGVGVRRSRVQPSRAARRENHRLRADRRETASEEIPGDHALAASVVDDELPREVLLVRRDVALHDLLVEDVDQDVARDVGCVRRSRLAGRAERALRDAAVLRAREDRAPVLELVDVVRRLLAEDLDRVLVAEVVRPLHRVERVLLGVVLGRVPERGVDPALRRAGVAANRVDLGDHRDVRAGVESLDRRAHSRAAGTHDDDIVNGVHCEGRYLIDSAVFGGRFRRERRWRGRSWPRSSAPCRSSSRRGRRRSTSGTSSPSPPSPSGAPG